jgi:carboxypeptidase PM20D1
LAYFDARLLPDENPKVFLEKMRWLVDEEQVEVFSLGEGEISPPSPLDTPLYEALCQVIRKKEGDVLIVPSLIPGATDSRFFRSKGIPCYDFSPLRLSHEEMRLIHNQNERLSLENLHFAIDFLYELILQIAT